MRVVVVGGGFGGMASAARLAKLGHDVTVLERSGRLGGAMTAVSEDGYTWDAGPTAMLLPAVVRDLFRKSGRPVEDELVPGLEPLELVREHRFEDGSTLRLPGGSRTGQVAAFDELEPGLGAAWEEFTGGYAEVWEVLRRGYLEEPWDRDALPPELAAVLGSRETLHRRLRKAFRDDRPALVAGYPHLADGHDLRNVPAWAGVTSYLEQLFGTWTVPGGMHRLTGALADRLALRGVTVQVDTEVRDLVVRQGRVAAVLTEDGEVAADVVVCAVDPRRLPALARSVERTTPALPPVVSHLGLDGAHALPELPRELVLHGDPSLVVHTGGTAPPGCAAWTLHGRGRLAEDMLRVLARHHLDVRDRVAVRVDRSPRDLVQEWGGSPHGVAWSGRGTVRARLGPDTPVPGVYAAGAHATPGAGLHHVGLSAALVASVVGPA